MRPLAVKITSAFPKQFQFLAEIAVFTSMQGQFVRKFSSFQD